MNTKKNKTIKNTVKLLVANISVSAISFFSIPVVSRLYTPTDFGDAAYFLSIVGITAGVSSLRYDASIVLTPSFKEARIMFLTSTIICILVSVLAWFIAMLINRMSPGSTGVLSKYNGIFPFAIFLHGFSQTVISLHTKYKQFSEIGLMNITKVVVQQTHRIGLGVLGFASAFQMIFSVLTGLCVSIYTAGSFLRSVFMKTMIDRIQLKDIYNGIKRYKNFPLYSSWTYFINLLSIQLPFLLIGILFGTEKVGFFSAAIMLLGAPQLLSNAIGRVLYQQSVLAHSKGELSDIITHVYQRLVVYGIFPYALIAVYGFEITTFFFGERWTEAGRYSQYLSLMYFCFFFSSPLGHLYNVLEMQKVNLKFNLLRLLVQFLWLVIGGLLGSIFIALLGYAVSGSIVRYSSISWVLSKSGIDFRSNISIISRAILFSVLPLLLLRMIHDVYQVSLVISICILAGIAVAYYSMSLYRDKSTYKLIKDNYFIFFRLKP